MRKIEKKVWPQYFKKLTTGEKNYELRLGNFKPKRGDILILREWNPKTEKYTGQIIEKEVTYVSTFKIDKLFWPKQDIEKYGLSVISFKN